jgi:hypothetical protein
VGKVHGDEADKKGYALSFRELPKGQGKQAHCDQQLYDHGSKEPPRRHQGPGVFPHPLHPPGHPKIWRKGHEATDKRLPFAAELEAPNPQGRKTERCKLRPYDPAHDGFLRPRVIFDAYTCEPTWPRQRRSFP